MTLTSKNLSESAILSLLTETWQQPWTLISNSQMVRRSFITACKQPNVMTGPCTLTVISTAVPISRIRLLPRLRHQRSPFRGWWVDVICVESSIGFVWRTKIIGVRGVYISTRTLRNASKRAAWGDAGWMPLGYHFAISSFGFFTLLFCFTCVALFPCRSVLKQLFTIYTHISRIYLQVLPIKAWTPSDSILLKTCRIWYGWPWLGDGWTVNGFLMLSEFDFSHGTKLRTCYGLRFW